MRNANKKDFLTVISMPEDVGNRSIRSSSTHPDVRKSRIMSAITH